jgi:hypothetical protein
MEEDGAFWTSEPVLLLNAQAIPAILSTTFASLHLLAGLKGGLGEAPKKPVKVGVGTDEGTGTPSAEAPVKAHVFRADDNGAFWSEGLAGNIDWDAEESRAPEEGWEDSDENPFATKEEILAHLAMMDGDDIWIYSGHLGFRQPDNPALADNRPNYLVGWGYSEYTLISKDELVAAMGAHPPGLVALSGCQSWDMRDAFSGAKIFAGFTTVVDDKESDATVKRFIHLLWDGKTVAEAEAAANQFFGTRFYNKTANGTFRVECGDKTKTIYELLEVPRKPQ